MVIRLFSIHKERDHYMLAILAFLMVLAAAVLTVDSVFLFAFAGFMLMAVVTFVLLEMRRSSLTASIPAREPSDRQTYRRMAFFLAGTSPVLVVLILAGASAIFFLLPRMSAGVPGVVRWWQRYDNWVQRPGCNLGGSVRFSNRMRS